MGPEVVIGFSALYGAGVAGNIIGSTIYDLRELKNEKHAMRNPKSKQYRKKSLISVIITSRNDESNIVDCLESVVANTYRKYEIVVVDNASKDSTANLVQEFIKSHKKAKITLLKKRRKVGQDRAMTDGLKKAKGELIMPITTREMLEAKTLANTSRHFATDEIDVLETNVNLSSEPSIVSAVHQFVNLMDARSKKIDPLVNSVYGIRGSGVVYTKAAFRARFAPVKSRSKTKRATTNATPAIKYARDAHITAKPASTYRELLDQRYELKTGTLNHYLRSRGTYSQNIGSKVTKALKSSLFAWKELTILLSPLALSLFAYLAFKYDQKVMFGIVWGVLAATMAYIVWTSEGTKLRDKLRLSLFLPVMYVLFYAIATIEIVSNFAYLGTLKRSKKFGSKKRKLAATAKAVV